MPTVEVTMEFRRVRIAIAVARAAVFVAPLVAAVCGRQVADALPLALATRVIQYRVPRVTGRRWQSMPRP